MCEIYGWVYVDIIIDLQGWWFADALRSRGLAVRSGKCIHGTHHQSLLMIYDILLVGPGDSLERCPSIFPMNSAKTQHTDACHPHKASVRHHTFLIC